MGDGIARAAARSAGTNLVGLVRARPLVSFVVLLLLLTWPLQIVGGTAVMGLVGPSVCAIVIVAVTDGRRGVVALLRRILFWRAPGWCYPFVLVGFGGLLFASAYLASAVLFVPGPGPVTLPLVISLVVNLVVIVFAAGLTEEFGWRGFLLPRLQDRYGPLRATLVVGLLWALWHFPLIIVSRGGPSMTLVWFTVGVVGASFAYTWVFNAAGGSVLLVALLHASENAWTGRVFEQVFAAHYDPVYAIREVVGLVVGLVIVLATRGLLGRARRGADGSRGTGEPG